MTRNAMGGDLTFRKALADRLELIKPRRQQIETILSIPGLIRLTDGMKELVDELRHVTSMCILFLEASTNSLIP